jgi:hypothetical protein
MSDEELFEKFDDCARRALPRDQIAPLYDRLENLAAVADIAQVTALAEVRRPLGAAPASWSRDEAAALAPEGAWVP